MKLTKKILSQVFLKKAFLFFLIASAFFLRFYNLKDTLQFQGDQGRDAMIVADIFREKNLVFIGPVTSVGNMYLGPLYYYFMMPFLWLSYPSPMGPVYAVAILGVITTWLVYFLGKKMIGEKGALIATFFYTFSATIISNTRFSWNPNPAPLISIIMIYLSYLAWKKNYKYWIGVIFCFAILIQLHYLTLLTAPAAGIIWLLSLRDASKTRSPKGKTKSEQNKVWDLLKPTFIGVLIFIASLTPLILFDIKHNGNNLKAFQGLLSQEDNFKYVADKPFLDKTAETLKENEGRAMHILFEYMIGKNRVLNKTLLYGFLAIIIYSFTNKKGTKDLKNKDRSKEIVIGTYLLMGIIGTAFYEHSIFDHYIAYLFPVTALTYGYVFSKIKPKVVATLVLLGFTTYFIQYNFPKLPLKSTGWTITDIQRTSKVIEEHTKPGEKYNIVLLSESHDIDGQNYRYFLTTGENPPVRTEQRGEVETLFIINEERKLKKVTDSPIYEIVVFPNKEPAEIFEIEGGGPEITVLRK